MRAFEIQGMWWLPEFPESRVFGSLACSETGELRLSLLGHLVGSWVGGRRGCPVLFGVVREDAGSKDVTLLDCIVTKATFSSGLVGSTEQLFAHRGYFGAHVPAGSAWTYTRAEVCYSGLSGWATSLSGFSTSVPSFTATWKSPEPIIGEVGGGTALLGIGCKTSYTSRERRLTESVGLVFKFKPSIPVEAIEVEYVTPIQNFFTFATDNANAVSSLELTPSHANESFGVIGAATFSDEDAAANLVDAKMLFTLEDVPGRLPTLLRTWLELHKRYSAAFSLYFGGLYRPPGYTDLRFSLLIQAITLYVAAQPDGPSEVASGVRHSRSLGESTDHVSDLLAIHPLLTGRQAVEAMMARTEDVFTPLLGIDGNRRSAEFLDYVTATHRYTITRQAPADRHARDGADLYWLCERLGVLFKISLLGDLGFTTDHILRLLSRNRVYTHLRDSVGTA